MTEHYLVFTAAINENSMALMVQYLVELQRTEAEKLTIGLSSPGGNVVCGITMYNALRACSFPVVTHNIGNVDSIANAVFLAGERRYTNESSTFMFHGVGFDSNPNERLEEKNLLEKLDTVNAEHKRISQLISSHSGLDVAVCMALFKEQKTRDATWALDNGIVSQISEFRIPQGVDVRHLT